jgi:hypothetical protein
MKFRVLKDIVVLQESEVGCLDEWLWSIEVWVWDWDA